MMTIDKAIEYLERMHPYMKISWGTMGQDSIKLGIEALKEVKASREEDYIGDTGLLPGETEE